MQQYKSGWWGTHLIIDDFGNLIDADRAANSWGLFCARHMFYFGFYPQMTLRHNFKG